MPELLHWKLCVVLGGNRVPGLRERVLCNPGGRLVMQDVPRVHIPLIHSHRHVCFMSCWKVFRSNRGDNLRELPCWKVLFDANQYAEQFSVHLMPSWLLCWLGRNTKQLLCVSCRHLHVDAGTIIVHVVCRRFVRSRQRFHNVPGMPSRLLLTCQRGFVMHAMHSWKVRTENQQ